MLPVWPKYAREAYPDFTSWAQDPSSNYFDPEKATPENPRWLMVDIEAFS